MTDNKEYWGTPSDRGNINISEDVISSIATIATEETDGVELANGSLGDLAGLLGKKSKGIKISFVYDNVEVDISCQVKFGLSIFDTAKVLQENVKNAVESMTGLVCTAVNVSVVSIVFEKE